MGKKYFDTKAETLESSILGVWTEAAKKVAETNKNDKSDDGDGMDAVQPKAVKKKFKDRKDKDIDNDGDTDDSDEYLHNRRKTVSKAVKGKVKDEGNAFGMALKAAKDKGEKTFVVAGKTYEVKEEADLDEVFNGTKQDVRKITRATDNALRKRSSQIQKMLKSKTNEKGKGLTDFEFDHISDEGDAIAAELVYRKKGGKDPISDDIPSHLKKFVSEDLDEGLGVAEDVPAMEVGTDRYREYASDLTPGETDPEWVQARDFKVASMKEALAKVWGLDEKVLDKSSKEEYDEEDEELKPVKGSKTMTGGKVAKVDTKPKIDG